jgi:hypothetical protein
MKTSIATSEETVAPGKIRFFDAIQPPLEAGAYTLVAEQKILDIPNETVRPYASSQQILIDGPRFVLNPAQIHTVYPPANQTGTFDDVLPNIVFNNFSLPWSRGIDPLPLKEAGAVKGQDADGNNIPWMGLLTLYPGDLEVVNGKVKVESPKTILVTELAKPEDPKILSPALGDLFGAEKEQVSVVDMDLAFFQSISPTLAELPFLAHARTVNTGGKVLLGMEDDGCFSLVVGNRLPMAAARNNIYLVSYEGHQAHLRGSTIGGGYTKIRLVLLGSWQFTADASRGSFIQLMANLCEKGRGGVTLLQMPGAEEMSATAKEAIETGYVPLQNNMRQGETSTSWYRGPLMPAPTKRDDAYGPYHYSDHAIHYDPEYGLFNHAYSAAWQIGRLLALSDASFSNALFNWRNTYLKVVVDQAKKVGPEKMRIISGMSEGEKTPVNMMSAMQHLFSEGFKKVAWPQVTTRMEIVAGEHLPGLFSDEEKVSIIENEEDPLLMLAKKLKGASL